MTIDDIKPGDIFHHGSSYMFVKTGMSNPTVYQVQPNNGVYEYSNVDLQRIIDSIKQQIWDPSLSACYTVPGCSLVLVGSIFGIPTVGPTQKPSQSVGVVQSKISITIRREPVATKYTQKCPICGSPAYIGFTETECSKGCKFVWG